jgi:hypothetical protein
LGRTLAPLRTGLNRENSVPSTALDIRTIKAAIGALALVAAVAAGIGATLVAPLFGALAALALSAGAGVAATLELLDADPHWTWRATGWSALVLGWIALAALLLSTPLRDLDGLRVLSSLLLAGGAALRFGRWCVRRGGTVPGLAITLGCTLLALATTWSGWALQTGYSPLAALSIGCAVELFAAGSLWLGEALRTQRRQSPANEEARRQLAAALQMA